VKIEELNQQMKGGSDWTVQRYKKSVRKVKFYDRSVRGMGNGAARKYKRAVTKNPKEENFARPGCTYTDWKKSKDGKSTNPTLKGMSADHRHEIQLGGCPVSPSNLKMMSSRANEWIGGRFSKFDPEKGHKSAKGECCPAGKASQFR